MNLKEKNDQERKNKLLLKAKECIYRHGTLRYCRSKVCACMGCVNSIMSEEEYHEAMAMPEVEDLIRKGVYVENGSILKWTITG